MAVASDLDPSRPHAVQLLGRRLVLWRDGGGAWRASEDRCPHRCAGAATALAAALGCFSTEGLFNICTIIGLTCKSCIT